MNKLIDSIANPEKVIVKLGQNYSIIPDRLYLHAHYIYSIGDYLNLKNPKTFSEKMQWLKLYYREPEFTMMVDKYSVKKYVADKIGEEYIIPTLRIWNEFKDIDFDKLPNQFVLKCTHDSGGLVICRDKSKLNIPVIKEKITKSLKRDYYLSGREWPYKNVPRKIIAEQYMKDSETEELRDYKFFCFDGKPKYCQVISNRSTNEMIDFFDMNWVHQPFTGLSVPGNPFSPNPIPIPFTFDTMKKSASILSDGLPFLRVDFYEINKKMYFGELTFYPASGFGTFTPDEWNYKLGDMIDLSKIKRK